MATAVGRRYARAAFELASEEGRVEEWRGRLEALHGLMSDPKLAAVLTNPTIPAGRRMELISAAESLLDREAVNLARLLIESSHVEDAGDILEEFDRLADEAAGGCEPWSPPLWSCPRPRRRTLLRGCRKRWERTYGSIRWSILASWAVLSSSTAIT